MSERKMQAEEQEKEQEKRNGENAEIRETGSLELGRPDERSGIELLTIIGEIEGHETVSGNTKATNMSTFSRGLHRRKRTRRYGACSSC